MGGLRNGYAVLGYHSSSSRPLSHAVTVNVTFFRERRDRERTRSAIIIQRYYRGLLGRRKTHRWRVKVVKIRERRIEASITIQSKYRMIR